MTIKHIRWVACIGLLAIICLQYVWLVNTYKLDVVFTTDYYSIFYR